MATTMITCSNPFPNTRHQPLLGISTCSRQQSYNNGKYSTAGTLNNVSFPKFHYNPKTVIVMWESPRPDWVKLNFDGGVSSGLAGCGYVLRDDMGRVLAAGCHDTPNLDVVDTELRGLWHGLQMAVKVCKRDQKIWIEGDSLTVITRLQKSFKYCPTDHSVAQDILRLLEHFSEIRASHIYREGNQVANWLASKGKLSRGATEWFADFPAKLESLAHRDFHECFDRVLKK